MIQSTRTFLRVVKTHIRHKCKCECYHIQVNSAGILPACGELQVCGNVHSTSGMIHARNDLRTMAVRLSTGSAVVLLFLFKRHSDKTRMKRVTCCQKCFVSAEERDWIVIGYPCGHQRHMLKPGVNVCSHPITKNSFSS